MTHASRRDGVMARRQQIAEMETTGIEPATPA